MVTGDLIEGRVRVFQVWDWYCAKGLIGGFGLWGRGGGLWGDRLDSQWWLNWYLVLGFTVVNAMGELGRPRVLWMGLWFGMFTGWRGSGWFGRGFVWVVPWGWVEKAVLEEWWRERARGDCKEGRKPWWMIKWEEEGGNGQGAGEWCRQVVVVGEMVVAGGLDSLCESQQRERKRNKTKQK